MALSFEKDIGFFLLTDTDLMNWNYEDFDVFATIDGTWFATIEEARAKKQSQERIIKVVVEEVL